jgi:hypothetical protein
MLAWSWLVGGKSLFPINHGTTRHYFSEKFNRMQDETSTLLIDRQKESVSCLARSIGGQNTAETQNIERTNGKRLVNVSPSDGTILAQNIY